MSAGRQVVQTDVGQFIHDAGMGLMLLFAFVIIPIILWAAFGPHDDEGDE